LGGSVVVGGRGRTSWRRPGDGGERASEEVAGYKELRGGPGLKGSGGGDRLRFFFAKVRSFFFVAICR